MPTKLPEFKIKWFVAIPVVVVGLVILIISLINASWVSLYAENNLDRYRINPIEFQIDRGNGVKDEVRYMLPQVSQVPGSSWYWLKDIRDQIWLNLSGSKGKKTKADMYLLLADKKIAELLVLSQISIEKKDDMFKCATRAVDYLIKSKKLADSMDNMVEAGKINQRVINARFFYSELFTSVGKITNDIERYDGLKNKLLV